MALFGRHKSEMPSPEDALPGRAATMPVPDRHLVLGTPLTPPFPDGSEQAVFGMGCFWGAERKFWEADGVITTAIAEAGAFYYAEDYHQQYLARNPNGYCGLGGTGVSCPVGVASMDVAE